MQGLPKIALARLKADPKSASAAWGPEAFQGAEHPDANLLAAFVEKTLTDRERTQVVNHLSQCADCREVATLARSADEPAAEPLRARAAGRWNPWPVLRWGAMAAVLGALTVVVVLHPTMWKGHPEISQATHPAVPAGSTSVPQSVTSAPWAQPPPKPAQDMAKLEARESNSEPAAVGSASGSHGELARNDIGARARAKRQATMMASTRAPATFRTEGVQAANVEQKKIEVGREIAVESAPAPAPSSGLAGATMSAPEEAAKASADSQAGQVTVRQITPSVEVTANAQPVGATNESVAVVRANAGTSSRDAVHARFAQRMAAQATVQMTAEAPVVAMRASEKSIGYGPGTPAALWSVSSDGKVQRSTDGGKTFEPVQVAPGIRFGAIAALGNNIWAGGARGTLFHSFDAGATWTEVAINSGANTVTESITAIHLHDPQHLTITTTSGSQWASEDGGLHWRKQP